MLFNKQRSCIETVNDLDGNVVNLFKWIQRDPERLARAIYWTPYAREIHNATHDTMQADSFYRAVNFCIQLNMGRGFRTNGEKVGWKNDVRGRGKAYAALDWKSLPDRLLEAAERLRGVQIDSRPAVELMSRFNYGNVLIYLDPPYMLETRNRKQYGREMEDWEHVELLEAALHHKGPLLISGYKTELYNTMLSGWHREEIVCRTQAGTKKIENLWMNFLPERQMKLTL